MKTSLPHPFRDSGLARGLFPLTAVLLACGAGPLAAQTIPNPGFEANSFVNFPGYVSGNTTITGWTGGPDASYGLNPATSSPFADNGTIPQGSNVGFIQSQNSGTPTELATEISGLTPDKRYRLSFRINARNGQDPILTVNVGDEELLNTHVASVGGTAPYRFVQLDFLATAPTMPLVLRNIQTGDTTVVVDDFKIAAAPLETATWQAEMWTDDSLEGSGLDPAFNYTHAYSFNSAASPVINEVLFVGIPGVNPAVPNKLVTAGLNAGFPNDTDASLFDASKVLANDFVYNGNPATITLQGLKPSTAHVLTLYSVGFDAQNGRWITFRAGEDALSIDQDKFGNNQGIRISYPYTSGADGTFTVTTQGLSSGSFHTYGLSNREFVAPVLTAPEIVTQPVGGKVLTGQTFTLTAAASGQPLPTYQWYLNGTAITNTPDGEPPVFVGAQSASLAVSVAGAAQAGVYTVKATNSKGTATSNGSAYLEVYGPRVGPLFSTGVDAAGAALAAGDPDPHYTLTVNPDGDPDLPPVAEGNIPGPWIANTASTQWVGPQTDTVNSAIGVYTYKTTFDIGANADAFKNFVFYAVDNVTREARLNGEVISGFPLSQGYAAYTEFTLDKTSAPSLKAGSNVLEIDVDNITDVGFTGLRLASTEVPAGISPVVRDQPKGGVFGYGRPLTLSARAYGTAPLSYQWTLGGVDIPGANRETYTIGSFAPANEGQYAVKVSNSSGNTTSASAAVSGLTVVSDLLSSGVDDSGVPLEDGTDDPHYTLLINPNGDDNIPAVVQNTGVFPINDGTWLRTSATSKWISPAFDSAGAAGLAVDKGAGPGTYVYRTTFTLNGFNPASTVITGGWTSDNGGLAIKVNGVATGITAPGNFNALNAFRIDDSNADFVSGENTLDFVVQNADAATGYTGLRVDGLLGLAQALPVGNLPPVTISINGAGKPVIGVTGTPGLTYPIQRSTTLTPANSWSVIGQPIAPASGQIQFEDPNPPTGRAFYRVVVPVGGN